jgi:hypothetical protein
VYRERQQRRVAAKPAPNRQFNFFEMFFWGPPGSTNDLQCPGAEQHPNSPAAGYAQQYHPRIISSSIISGGDQQRADDPANSPRSTPY